MTEQLNLLVQLQEINLHKNQQKEQERALAEKLKKAEQTFEKEKSALEQFKAKKMELEKKRHAQELELKVQDENISKLKEKMTKLKTNEEYKAHIKEVEAANVKKGEQEEALLLLMEEEDRIKKDAVLKEKTVLEAKQQFDLCQKEINNEMERLSEAARSMDERWASLCQQVEPAILDQYKSLLISGKGLAVVPLSGPTCTGCHFSLPPQKVAEVKIGDKILTCTYCHRILYMPAQPVHSG